LVELFVGDTVSLVRKAFWKGIEARCQDEDPAVALLGNKEKQAYTEWAKLRYPLSMDAEQVTLRSTGRRQGRERDRAVGAWDLLQIITGGEADVSGENFTAEKLGKALVDMTKTASRLRAKAPLVQGGLLRQALPAAQERLVWQSVAPSNRTEMEKALGEALGRALKARKVELAPYHGPASGQSHPFAADPKWWLKVSCPTPLVLVSNEEFSSGVEETLREALRSPRTPWKLPEKPQHVKWFAHKTGLPEEWSLAAASLGEPDSRDGFIYDTYHWAARNYDGHKALHRMALLWSMLFSWILPHVGVPPSLSIRKAVTVTEATAEVLRIPWEEPTRKGTSARLPYVVMVTCVVISWLEPASPLRMHLASNNNVLGDAWTKKHGAFSSRVLTGEVRLSMVQGQSVSLQ
jgi:hypothetical protein